MKRKRSYIHPSSQKVLDILQQNQKEKKHLERYRSEDKIKAALEMDVTKQYLLSECKDIFSYSTDLKQRSKEFQQHSLINSEQTSAYNSDENEDRMVEQTLALMPQNETNWVQLKGQSVLSNEQRSRNDAQAINQLSGFAYSSFPSVQSIPLELQPFSRKLKIAMHVQDSNLKDYIREKIQRHAQLKIERAQKNSVGMKDHPQYMNPNAVNEKKIKMWTYKLRKKME